MSWDLRQNTAKWASPKKSIEIDLAYPLKTPWLRILDESGKSVLNLGITPNELQGQHVPAEIPFGEAYVRQNDLIAIYPEHAPSRFGYQIDVRMIDDAPSNAIAMEFWLSIQTTWLDSHPQLTLLLDGTLFNATTPGCWVNSKSQLGLMVHPLDQSDCRVEKQESGLLVSVFGRFMEKGVIRRMRFRVIAATQTETETYWSERFVEFSESPLPLTT